MPFGKGVLLVRARDSTPASALMRAAVADADFVSIPARGFAVVYGDAAKVRAVFGLATPWKGGAPCAAAL